MKFKLTIKVPVYSFTCDIIFDHEIESRINAVRKKQKLEPIEGTVHGYALGENNIHKYTIFYSLDRLSINTISHEISHLIDYVLLDREVDPPTGEPRAYLTGHVTEKVMEYIFKKEIHTEEWLKAQNHKKKAKCEIDVQNLSQDSQTNNKS